MQTFFAVFAELKPFDRGTFVIAVVALVLSVINTAVIVINALRERRMRIAEAIDDRVYSWFILHPRVNAPADEIALKLGLTETEASRSAERLLRAKKIKTQGDEEHFCIR